MDETELLWLDLTNAALGVAALIPLVLLAFAVFGDILHRLRHRPVRARHGSRA